jgi:hypothetical protein
MAKVTIDDDDDTTLVKLKVKYTNLPNLLKELEEKFS